MAVRQVDAKLNPIENAGLPALKGAAGPFDAKEWDDSTEKIDLRAAGFSVKASPAEQLASLAGVPINRNTSIITRT